MDLEQFKGKIAVVTGAGAGIGRSLCVRLHQLGVKVYAISKTQENLDTLKAECPNIEVIRQDVSDWKGTRRLVEALPTFDYLVNNAGIGEQNFFIDVPEEELDKMWSVNLKPVVNLGQVMVKKLVEAKKPGAIVNVSSQASKLGMAKHTSYGATKAAMDHVTRVMANELGPFNIRTNAVNPTVTLTPMGAEFWNSDPAKADKMKARIPLGKFAEPKDVVDGIIFLLSDSSSMINGITMPIDGGYTAC